MLKRLKADQRLPWLPFAGSEQIILRLHGADFVCEMRHSHCDFSRMSIKNGPNRFLLSAGFPSTFRPSGQSLFTSKPHAARKRNPTTKIMVIQRTFGA